MTPIWVDRIGSFDVGRRESKRPGGQPYIPLANPRAFVLHTTEGTTVDGAWQTLNERGSAPHFLVGENRIVQMRPLDVQAATLRDNGGGWHPNDVGWQVECVGKSLGIVHKLTPSTWEPLVALTSFVAEVLGVPLRRPDGWRDDLSDITTMLATNNTRRQTRIAVTFRGILHHMEIPDQDPTWHWDCGALNNTALIAEAKGDDMTPEEKEKLLDAYAIVNAVEDFLNDEPPGDEARRSRKRAYNALKRASNRPEAIPGPAGPAGPQGPKGDVATLPAGSKLQVVED